MIFRIPTPVFGAGLIEQISDSRDPRQSGRQRVAKSALGIRGSRTRRSGAGLGSEPQRQRRHHRALRWKAQNKSLLLFAGEAYNVEMGITNELFQTERDETPACQFATVPNDITEHRRGDDALDRH